MSLTILSAPDFYASVARYMHEVDPSWAEERFQEQVAREKATLPAALGAANERSVLDCACGEGGQAIPLAEMGWRVTASDITEEYLMRARQRAHYRGLGIRFRAADMRYLGEAFRAEFDQVVCCMALDNLTEDRDLLLALSGMREALRPGGACYIRQRDFDHILAVRPRYEMKEDRPVPHGRVIRLEDWVYESDTHMVCVYVFSSQDDRRDYPWRTDVFACRRRALRKAELSSLLRQAGFAGVTFLPQPSPWHPYEVVARRPGAAGPAGAG